MSTPTAVVIGIDPGPTPGVVALVYSGEKLTDAYAAQVDHRLAATYLDRLIEEFPNVNIYVGMEQFVIGRRSGRSSSAKAGQITRSLIGLLEAQLLDDNEVQLVKLRSASVVKTWATDQRLAKAGLIAATVGMTHARDAARHALFTAVADAGVPDPLSRRAR